MSKKRQREAQIHTFDPGTVLSFPSASNKFAQINSDNLRLFLSNLSEGVMLLCRGRDTTSDDWDYGIATKSGERLFIHYESNDAESIRCDSISSKLVEFVQSYPTKKMKSTTKGVIILSHGWSPQVGPNYPLINALRHIGVTEGFEVIVPDFKSQIHQYTTNQARSRAERVKVIYEEMLCLDSSIDYQVPIILVGHSQGGAASATACTDKLCKTRNICGLLMLGSENPISLDKMNWIPQVENVKIIHATGDNVIGIESLRKCAQKWNCDFKELTSTAVGKDKWGDDINHDFLAKDLMRDVKIEFQKFIRQCIKDATHQGIQIAV